MAEVREGLKSFFSEVDKGSQMPGWCFEEQMNQIEESIRYKRNALEKDYVPSPEKANFRESLKRDEERLEKIKSSRPKYTEKEKDEIARLRDELGETLSVAMPTRSQMEKRLVDAHDEVKRSLDPCIPISGTWVDLAQLKAVKGKGKDSGKLLVSRDDATKAWQIASKVLEEGSNPELLRRD
jgi:hypothetical protein